MVRARGQERDSGVVAVAVIVVVEVFVVVVVPVVLVLVVLFFLFLIVVVARPAFRLLGVLQVELVPGIEVDLLDIAVLVLNLDDLFVRIDRQHPEDLILFEILVPLSLNRVVVSGHANTSRSAKRKATGRGILGAFAVTAKRGARATPGV